MHHFGTNGLSNGLAVLADEQTWSCWDHITGECFEGEHLGQRLEGWPIRITTAAAARVERPQVRVLISPHRSIKSFLVQKTFGKRINARGMFPPGFRRTMHEAPDPRLPRLAQGLGVVEGDAARFYPMRALLDGPVRDRFAGRTVVVTRGEIDGVPRAVYEDGTEPTMQLLSRWYGFAFTWPDCTVLGEGEHDA